MKVLSLEDPSNVDDAPDDLKINLVVHFGEVIARCIASKAVDKAASLEEALEWGGTGWEAFTNDLKGNIETAVREIHAKVNNTEITLPAEPLTKTKH